MRLLNTSTREFKEFANDFPPYAILSHTWVQDEEVTLQDLQKYHEFIAQGSPASTSISSRVGFKKIEGCCDLALRDGLNYAWIDTCCIDKTSSAELTEAINSMFKWYKESDVCYAYLVDVEDATEDFSAADSSFRRSRWFERGWTLQELLAPRKVQFFSKEWELIGQMDKFTKLCDVVSSITLIPPAYLEGEPLRGASVAQRMSWASKRKTTREEDIAYSLLGIFDVNMPLLYGEGMKAFGRLQEMIINTTYDHTLFAWGYLPRDEEYSAQNKPCDILATSPADFRNSHDLIVRKGSKPSHYEMTNLGLKINLRLSRDWGEKIQFQDDCYCVTAMLDCSSQLDPSTHIALPLLLPYQRASTEYTLEYNKRIFYRANRTITSSLLFNNDEFSSWERTILIARSATQYETTRKQVITVEIPRGYDCEIKYVYSSIETRITRLTIGQNILLITFPDKAFWFSAPRLLNILPSTLVPICIGVYNFIHHIITYKIRQNERRLCLQLTKNVGSSDLAERTSFIASILLKPGLPPSFMECILSPPPMYPPDEESTSQQLGVYLHLKGRKHVRLGNEIVRAQGYGPGIGSMTSERHFIFGFNQGQVSQISRNQRLSFTYSMVRLFASSGQNSSLQLVLFASLVTSAFSGKSVASVMAAYGACFIPLWFETRGNDEVEKLWNTAIIFIYYGVVSVLLLYPDSSKMNELGN